jgi:glutamate-1-semialdehyde 2,1-aminomutase
LARAFTHRDKIVKFEGGFHGMSAEAQMSLAPRRLADFPVAVADSAGIPESVRGEVLIAPFNDAEFTRSLISKYADQIAAIIVEPFQRIIPPAPGFLETLREECSRYGIVLIFDEIVTGFRFSYGGAQSVYDVVPDLCTLGKIIGGGLPLAAIAGRSDIMAHFDKNKVGAGQSVMQVGTLSGNPLAVAAGLKTLEILQRPGQYEKLERTGQTLMQGFVHCLKAAGHSAQSIGHPTLFDVVFSSGSVENYREVLLGNKDKAAHFNSTLRKNRILKIPGKFYISLALTDDDIAKTLGIVEDAASALPN